ncbi:MAG: hypothetical protein M1827_000670 [Pycnora praestabilis]|nr:MAG: hypothetical protein M1827_000670 [Pycnora praestabilis]
MPLYDIEHTLPLTPNQQSRLAVSLTHLHSTTFHVPSYFINVRFWDVSTQPITFRGGVRRDQYNRAILRTRQGGLRSVEDYNRHFKRVVEVWNEIVELGEGDGEGHGEKGMDKVGGKARELRAVWVMGALTTAIEDGIARPAVGEEREWVRANIKQLKRKADEGDEDYQEVIREIEERENLQAV